MAVLQECGEKADFLLVMLFLWIEGGPLGGGMCRCPVRVSLCTLDGLRALLHASTPEQTLENKCHKWKAFNS